MKLFQDTNIKYKYTHLQTLAFHKKSQNHHLLCQLLAFAIHLVLSREKVITILEILYEIKHSDSARCFVCMKFGISPILKDLRII